MSSRKPTQDEEDYFARLDREKLERLKAQKAAEEAAKAAADRKELHFNKCGKCGGQMHPKLFKGVEIDICEDCSAVLLDPGELEELAGEDGSGVMGTLSDLFQFSRRKR